MGRRNTTPLEMFYRWESEVPSEVFLRQSLGSDGWLELTWGEVADRVRKLANFICAQGFRRSSSIAIWSSNNVDWPVVDLAIQLSGHVAVPLFPGQDAETARYIMNHAEVKLIFVGESGEYAALADVVPDGVTTVAMRGATVACDHAVDAIVASFERLTSSPIPDPDSLLTIVYSSGTTGRPKGIMLSHGTPRLVADAMARWIPQADAAFEGERARLFSFLPMAHLAERAVIEMVGLFQNAVISFSAGAESFAEEMRSVEPTFFFAVPRLWMKFKAAVDAKVPPEVQADFGETEKKLLRQQLGMDKLSCVLSGSAPIAKELHQWYLDLGIVLREAYGMSETCGLATITQTDGDLIPGTVGTPFAGIEIKISDDGEICIKTESMMMGYYKDPERTSEAVVDGWYHSGDLGYIGDEGLLRVTGRVGDVFKTTKGKFVHPAVIEDKFGALPELGQLLAFGHGRDQPLLLANLSEYGKEQTANELEGRLTEALSSVNSQLQPHERVAQIFVCAEEWTAASGLLTPTMKIKRKAVESHYHSWIESDAGTEDVVFESRVVLSPNGRSKAHG